MHYYTWQKVSRALQSKPDAGFSRSTRGLSRFQLIDRYKKTNRDSYMCTLDIYLVVLKYLCRETKTSLSLEIRSHVEEVAWNGLKSPKLIG